jgi:hypothetical protein
MLTDGEESSKVIISGYRHKYGLDSSHSKWNYKIRININIISSASSVLILFFI